MFVYIPNFFIIDSTFANGEVKEVVDISFSCTFLPPSLAHIRNNA